MASTVKKNRVAIKLKVSAGFYFGSSRVIRARLLKWKVAHAGKEPSTGDEYKDAFGIKSDAAWSSFFNAFIRERGVVRTEGWNYSGASKPDPVATFSIDPSGGQQQQSVPSPDASGNTAEWQKVLDTMRRDAAALKTSADAEVAKAKAQADLATKVAADAAAMVQKIKDEAAKPQGPVTVVVENRVTEKTTKLDMQHMTLPRLLSRLKAGLSVYLVGPAGSGKTFAAESASRALGLEFGFMSVGPQTTKTDILGFISATGSYIETEFRRRYEHGGVFLFDEIDAGNGGVLTCINAALAGSCAAFPDKMIKRHASFLCIAAGNTYGTGPDRVYVGRQELDGASIDRFDFIEWAYDEGLETAICNQLDAGFTAVWVPMVQAARKAVGQLGLRFVISPRASLGGVRLLREGVDAKDAAESQIWKAMKPAERVRVVEKMVANGWRADAIAAVK